MDTAAYTDSVIPPYYDSLIAKLISYGSDRREAIDRMKRALSMFVVEGIHTSIPLHERILCDEDFVAGNFDTSFLTKLSEKKARAGELPGSKAKDDSRATESAGAAFASHGIR